VAYFKCSELDGVIWQVFASFPGFLQAVPGMERARLEIANYPTPASLEWGARFVVILAEQQVTPFRFAPVRMTM
jgi:hypothetical protein